MKPILQTLNGTGSPFGFSHWSNVLVCAEMARLNKIYGGGSTEPQLVGTIFHTFQKIYFSRASQFEAVAVKFTNMSTPEEEAARIKAEALFRAFRLEFPNTKFFGRVVAVEKPLPTNKSQAKRIEEAVGISPSTCQLDLASKLTKRDCDKWKRRFRITLTPGYWLIDWKTAAYMSGALYEYYLTGLQLTSYQLSWNAAFPRKKLQGALIVVITKERIPSIHVVKIPPPKVIQVARLHDFYDLAKSKENDGPNFGACIHWRNGTCHHRLTGNCRAVPGRSVRNADHSAQRKQA